MNCVRGGVPGERLKVQGGSRGSKTSVARSLVLGATSELINRRAQGKSLFIKEILRRNYRFASTIFCSSGSS
ncbi:hypothetical protein E2C01_060115 [Portunus trituberculatus]|uniref:Uncharacterized protein n=1 Tax=Portunus trituberculatus TaxID=210409 RepID=A0A5B7H4E4_PORTR|nr:hypothetical protein [Portunus trituberculatus]